MLHKNTVSEECFRLINDLMDIQSLDSFRLVGGTALALQKGHRQSVDIDLFCSRDFNNEDILMALEASLYPDRPEEVRIYPFGFFCTLRQIKTDFMYWGHSFAEEQLTMESIRMATPAEIFAMKLQAISGRSQKKDFVDIAILLDEIPLSQARKIFEQKYPEYDPGAVVKQLTYFDMAENSPMPDMLIPLTWEKVKEKIEIAVREYWEIELGESSI